MDKTRQVFENPSGFKIQNQRSLEAMQDPLGPTFPLLQRCAKQQGDNQDPRRIAFDYYQNNQFLFSFNKKNL